MKTDISNIVRKFLETIAREYGNPGDITITVPQKFFQQLDYEIRQKTWQYLSPTPPGPSVTLLLLSPIGKVTVKQEETP